MIADLRTLVSHRELLRDFAGRELRARYKGSVLCFGWNFVIPLLQLVVFWILFGILFGVRPRTASGEQAYPVFLFVGLLPWTFFATALQTGAGAIVSNAAIVKKVRLPTELLPAAAVLACFANLALSSVVLFAVLALFGPREPAGLLAVPLLVAIELVLALGFAYALAALTVFFRDVEHILGVLLMAWYFLTPVLFSVDLVANRPTESFLLHLNPMAPVIIGFQRALLDGIGPEWPWLAYSAVFALVMLVAGLAIFRRAKDSFEEAL